MATVAVADLKKKEPENPSILTLAPGEIALRFVNYSNPLVTTGSCTVGLGGSFIAGTGQGTGVVCLLALQINGIVRCVYSYDAPGGKVYMRSFLANWSHAVE